MKNILILIILICNLTVSLEKEKFPLLAKHLAPRHLTCSQRPSHHVTVELRTRLYNTTIEEDPTIVIDLLDQKGVSPNKSVYPNSTPLIQAIHQDTDILVDILLRYNADPNKYCWNTKKQPLIEAIRFKKVSIIKKFIEKKVDLERTDSEFNSALTYACTHYCDSSEIIMLLLRAGANINHRNLKKENALSIMCIKDLYVTEQLIAAKIDVNNCDRFGLTPLTKVILALTDPANAPQAAQLIATATVLLAHGADPDHFTRKGYSARTAAQDAQITLIDFPSKKGSS